MTTQERRPTPVAIWLLTAAILAFAATALGDLDGVWRWNVAALGLALLVAGGVRLCVELVQRFSPAVRDAPREE